MAPLVSLPARGPKLVPIDRCRRWVIVLAHCSVEAAVRGC
jgi:hypothetical protein